MIRVLVADDEEDIREGVRAVLEADPEIRVVAQAGDGRRAVELARVHNPDVCLLGIRMPRWDGLTAAREIRRRTPAPAVLILTTFGEDAAISQALGEGADGFLLKSGDPAELIAGIHSVAAGEAFLSPAATRRVLRGLNAGWSARTRAEERVGVLTEREQEVLALIGAGLSNAEIARRLFLVEGTAKGYVSTLLDRLALRNRVEAAVLAREAGLRVEGEGA